ncbi:MAG: helix-turn-helix transcriptional regulator, partial [Lentisphaerae bacterium]|nr:helix-turn-helix transcriptional regulator [Lentisphaerota bacterium]
IAAMLHFCDDNHFSSAFKKHHGMTPREYRKKVSS